MGYLPIKRNRISILSILTAIAIAITFGCASKNAINTSEFEQAKASFENGNYKRAARQLRLQLDLQDDGKGTNVLLSEYVLLLSKSYFHLNKFDQALPLANEALTMAKKRWGESIKLVPYLKLKVRILYKQKKFQDSQKVASELLALQEKALGKDSSDIIDTLNLVIAAACAEDRCADTEPLLKRQLKLRKKYLGKSHEHIAASLSQLAEIEEKKGRFDKAESLYKEALAIRKKSAPHLVESTQKNLVRIQLKRLSPDSN